jgi:hypothetical protein
MRIGDLSLSGGAWKAEFVCDWAVNPLEVMLIVPFGIFCELIALEGY